VVWRYERYERGVDAKVGNLGETHVGNRTLDMMPALHGWAGISLVSPVLVMGSFRQVYVSCRYLSASALVREFCWPMSMRNPGWNAVTVDLVFELTVAE